MLIFRCFHLAIVKEKCKKVKQMVMSQCMVLACLDTVEVGFIIKEELRIYDGLHRLLELLNDLRSFEHKNSLECLRRYCYYFNSLLSLNDSQSNYLPNLTKPIFELAGVKSYSIRLDYS